MTESTIVLNNKDVVFIDAYNLIYRAFHGNKAPLTNQEGMPTNAITTVSNMLLKLKSQFSDLTFALAVFDGGGNFRKELDENYKANRKEMPEDLKVQMPHIENLFEILGWPCYRGENVEADDVIGTLSVRAAKKGYNVYIISSDKDFRQIVTPNLNVIDTMRDIVYTPDTVIEKMGVSPENVQAWLALNGDTSDNVAGVEKWGPGTITKYLNLYGNIDNLIANKADIKGKAGETLREAIDNGQLAKSLELVKLKTDVNISLTSKELRPKEIQQENWINFCNKMNIKKLLSSPKLR